MSLRPILAPQGLPEDEYVRTALWSAEGDLGRIIDAPTSSLDAYVSHLKKLRFLDSGPAPLVCFVDTRALGVVLMARALLEAEVPSLARASWLLLLQEGRAEHFAASAERLGTLDDSVDAVPLWKSRAGQYFVVVPPTPPIARLRARCAEAQMLAML
ncbi:MAG: hypothetical protein H6718_27310 [Polyangiaceae bacterium]|nr:hypothetical protein [Myxococcales bacterium]MCB9589153.1 hypothetical protein [Polyangiaceae bacterium]MCB9610013.1 hypothetical protein [Polyangiaceae bacterium]